MDLSTDPREERVEVEHQGQPPLHRLQSAGPGRHPRQADRLGACARQLRVAPTDSEGPLPRPRRLRRAFRGHLLRPRGRHHERHPRSATDAPSRQPASDGHPGRLRCRQVVVPARRPMAEAVAHCRVRATGDRTPCEGPDRWAAGPRQGTGGLVRTAPRSARSAGSYQRRADGGRCEHGAAKAGPAS